MVKDIDADEPPIEPGTVFAPMEDRDTQEIAIPTDAFDAGIYLALQALAEELASRWYGEPAIESIVEGVRKRVAG